MSSNDFGKSYHIKSGQNLRKSAFLGTSIKWFSQKMFLMVMNIYTQLHLSHEADVLFVLYRQVDL